MNKTGHVIRGALINWAAFAASILIGFFLSPFVVRHLGTVTYGVWTMLVALASYMGLMDFGLRGAVVRFVSSDHAKGNHEAASRSISAALYLRISISCLILAVSGALSWLGPKFLQIPSELVAPARLAVVVLGLNLSISLTCGVFGGVLTALHRFDVLSGVTIAQTALRAAGVIWLLNAKFGILALAIWELIAVVAGNSVLAWLCLRAYPQLKLRLQRPDRELAGKFRDYSAWVFVIHVGAQFIYYTDNLVVGSVISAAAVTFYGIGGGLIEYLRGVISSLTTTFLPIASRLDAVRDDGQMRELLIKGTYLTYLIALPIEIALFFRGQTFIALWMGPRYAVASGTVLQILIVAQLALAGNQTAAAILFGTGKHRVMGLWACGEASANFILSVVLARKIGIYGVALGTLIPSLVISLVLRPAYVCRLIGVPLARFFWNSWTRPMLAAIPYGVACYLSDRFWTPSSLAGLFLQIIAILPLFGIGVLCCFGPSVFEESWRSLRKPRTSPVGRIAPEPA